MQFPTLYKKDGNGRRTWKIWCEDCIVYKCYGKEGGKLITSQREVKALKTGKVTAEDQAAIVAKRDWIAQLDKEYRPDEITKEYSEMMEQKKQSGGNNHCLAGEDRKKPVSNLSVSVNTYLPNLAQKYSFDNKTRKHFDYTKGVYIQPKLDGQRCIAFIDNGKVFLTTRKGKQWLWIDHIRKDILKMFNRGNHLVLDGELYIHSSSQEEFSNDTERFAFISSCCRTVRKEPHPKEKLIEYHVFDIIEEGFDQVQRFDLLDQILEDYRGKYIKKVSTAEVFSEEEMKKKYAEFIVEGYEGIIIRSPKLMYRQNKRDLLLRKHKEFYDSDYLIINAIEAEGTQKGCVVWVCQTTNEEQFTCGMKGTLQFRKQMYKDREEYIGKLLIVRHQTPPDGEEESSIIPRFPVGLGIREDM